MLRVLSGICLVCGSARNVISGIVLSCFEGVSLVVVRCVLIVRMPRLCSKGILL